LIILNQLMKKISKWNAPLIVGKVQNIHLRSLFSIFTA
jgi:hypothetical protein